MTVFALAFGVADRGIYPYLPWRHMCRGQFFEGRGSFIKSSTLSCNTKVRILCTNVVLIDNCYNYLVIILACWVNNLLSI